MTTSLTNGLQLWIANRKSLDSIWSVSSWTLHKLSAFYTFLFGQSISNARLNVVRPALHPPSPLSSHLISFLTLPTNRRSQATTSTTNSSTNSSAQPSNTPLPSGPLTSAAASAATSRAHGDPTIWTRRRRTSCRLC